NADEVVALGASIQGSSLMDERSNVLLLDVTPHNLGITIVGGYFQPIIEKNTTVPTSAGHVFTTVRDNQTSVRIMVLQGDSLRADDPENEFLGEFILSGLREAPRGEVEIEVQFEISADGIVSVAAKDLETGLQQSITVTATSGLTEEEIRRMAAEAEEYAVATKHSDAVERLASEIASTVRDVDEILPRVRRFMSASEFGREALLKAENTRERAQTAVERRDPDELQVVKEPLERTLRMLRGVDDKMPDDESGAPVVGRRSSGPPRSGGSGSNFDLPDEGDE
ncbi:MAG: Hsp70 family protein, partial [Myxococcota bacterium]